MREPGFIWANSASPIIPRVDAISGVWIVRKSADFSSSGKEVIKVTEAEAATAGDA
jgi:hypothetical protein